MLVKWGDTPGMDTLRDQLQMTHPQIILEDADHFYDLETFNRCEATGPLSITVDAWAHIHPSFITISVDWDYPIRYGLLFSKTPSETAMAFLNALKNYQVGNA